MKFANLPMSVCAAAFLASCGPVVDQSPENQRIADALHEQMMASMRTYVTEAGVKALAACITWDGNRPVDVSYAFSYYYPTRHAYRTRSVALLEQSALGDCAAAKSRDGSDCDCQLIDRNGRNAIVVPGPAGAISGPVVATVAETAPAPIAAPAGEIVGSGSVGGRR